MSLPSHAVLAERLLPAVCEAARLILKTRAAGLVVDTKADRSPVTEADRQSEAILVKALKDAAPGIPIIAEENTSAGNGKAAEGAFFLVDPLDGTRAYCAGGPDFTINIGLIDGGRPIFGMICAPALHEIYLTREMGSSLWAPLDPAVTPANLDVLKLTPLTVRVPPAQGSHALLSESETGEKFAARVAALGAVTSAGVSSSVKFCMIARGEADLYPRFGPTCEWDTAAGQAILEAAGGRVTQLDGSPMIYGKTADGYLNGPFLARGAQVAQNSAKTP